MQALFQLLFFEVAWDIMLKLIFSELMFFSFRGMVTSLNVCDTYAYSCSYSQRAFQIISVSLIVDFVAFFYFIARIFVP